jgi:periplasmic divalent cation tolerance protein
MTDKIVVFSTCGSAEEAERIARHLVETRVAACVSITPGLRSIYRWKGAIEDEGEWGLTIKSRRDLFPRLCAELRRVHSYSTPEILAVQVVDGDEAYLAWLDREVLPPDDEPPAPAA